MKYFLVAFRTIVMVGDGVCHGGPRPLLISAPTREEALALVPSYLPDKMCRLYWYLWVEELPDLRQLCQVFWKELIPDQYGSIVIPEHLGLGKEELNSLLPESKGYQARVEAWGTKRPCDDLSQRFRKPNPGDPLDVHPGRW